MKATDPSNWQRAKRMAFWDQGKLTYQNWLKDIKQKKPQVIQQSINYMRSKDFIELIGEKQFIKMWPEISKSDSLNMNKKAILDAVWSLRVVGDVSFPVNDCVIRFHPKKRQTLKALLNSNGNMSIYSIAKSLGRNPRRIYDDIHDFSDKGLVFLEESEREGRKVLIPKVKGYHVREILT